jgi:transketolase
VEHVASLRLIPGLEVWRPCDSVESLAAWVDAIERRGRPTALVFTRQTLPHQDRDDSALENIVRGGYVLYENAPAAEAGLDAIIMASGSEVQLGVEAARELEGEGVGVRVVSMPNPDRFVAQSQAYRDSVLPPDVTNRVAVEAGVTAGWHALAGDGGTVLGIDRFGASAPGNQLFEEYGLTAAAVAGAVRAMQ